MSDIGGIQLLPQARKELKIKQKKGDNKFLYISIAILSSVVVLGSGLTFYKMSLESKIDDLNNRFTALDKRRDKSLEHELKVLNSRFSVISDLIKNHIFITQALDKLSGLINEKVQVLSLSMSAANGKISLHATGPSYTTVARQLSSFLSSDLIKTADLGSMSVGTDGKVEFGIELAFDKSKLLQKQ